MDRLALPTDNRERSPTAARTNPLLSPRWKDGWRDNSRRGRNGLEGGDDVLG